jgi:hypothetical protein
MGEVLMMLQSMSKQQQESEGRLKAHVTQNVESLDVKMEKIMEDQVELGNRVNKLKEDQAHTKTKLSNVMGDHLRLKEKVKVELMGKVDHLEKDMDETQDQLKELREEVGELKEQIENCCQTLHCKFDRGLSGANGGTKIILPPAWNNEQLARQRRTSTSNHSSSQGSAVSSLLSPVKDNSSIFQPPMIKKPMKLQTYSGDTDASHFRGHCEIVAKHNGWTIEELRDQIYCVLKGQAVQLVTMYYPDHNWTLGQLWELLEPKFKKPQLDKVQAEYKLQSMRYVKGQSLEDLGMEILRLMGFTSPSAVDPKEREAAAVTQLLKMMPEKVKLWVACQNPTSLEQTYKLIHKIEDLLSQEVGEAAPYRQRNFQVHATKAEGQKKAKWTARRESNTSWIDSGECDYAPKNLQQPQQWNCAREPTNQHPPIPAKQHQPVSTNQHLPIPTNQYPSIPANQYQHQPISTNQHLPILTNQHHPQQTPTNQKLPLLYGSGGQPTNQIQQPPGTVSQRQQEPDCYVPPGRRGSYYPKARGWQEHGGLPLSSQPRGRQQQDQDY